MKILAEKLEDAKELVATCTGRKTKWSRFWHSKGDRAALVEAQEGFRQTMNDAQFTMLVDSQKVAVAMRDALDGARSKATADTAAEDALRERILASVGGVDDEVQALRAVMAEGNEGVKQAVLKGLQMQESELAEGLEGLLCLALDLDGLLVEQEVCHERFEELLVFVLQHGVLLHQVGVHLFVPLVVRVRHKFSCGLSISRQRALLVSQAILLGAAIRCQGRCPSGVNFSPLALKH